MTESGHQQEVQSAVSRMFGRDMGYMVAWAAQAVLTALLTPVTTRLMLPTQYGLAMAGQTVMQLLYGILGFGLFTGTQRAFAREGEDAARRVITLALTLALIGGALVYASGRWWAPAAGLGSFSLPFREAVVWAALASCTAPCLGLLRSRDQMRWYMAGTIAQSVFAQVVALLAVDVVAHKATAYLGGQILGQVVAVTVVLAFARPLRVSRAHRAMLARIFKFSVLLVPAATAEFVTDASDRLIVHGELGSAALGRYAVASNCGGFVSIILGSLGVVWSSRLLSIEDDRVLRDVVGITRDGLAQVAATLAVGLAAASPIVLVIWSPSRYHPDSLLLVTALVAATSIPWALSVPYAQAMIAAGRSSVIAVVTFIGALLNVGLNLALIPRYGLDGSAAASLIEVTCLVAAYHLLLGANRPPLRLGVSSLLILGAAVCVGSSALSPHGLALLLRLALFVVAAGLGCARLLSLAGPGALDSLRRMLRRPPASADG